MEPSFVDGIAVRHWGDQTAPGILLWPGLGFTGVYFADVAQRLPGRCVAVDPPGFGRSQPLEACSYEHLVELAANLVERCRCRAIVAHSLGGDIAVGVCNAPPPGLRACVLIDGGYLDDTARIELDEPLGRCRRATLRWWRENEPHYPDWQTALDESAAAFGCRPSPALEAILRETLVETDGSLRPAAAAELAVNLIVATRRRDTAALARGVAVPTLLIAAGQPPEERPAKQRAWEAFAAASPLADLHVAEDWSHNLLLEDPAEAGELISHWLAARL